MTLTEVLLAGTLSVVFLAQVLGFLVPSMRVQLRLSSEADQVRLGSLALEKLAADLRSTPVAGLSLLQEPQRLVLALHRSQDLTGDGQAVYAPEVRAYCWNREEEAMQLVDFAPAGTAPWRLQPEGLRVKARLPGRRLVGNVRDLRLTHAGVDPASVTSPLELTLTLPSVTLTRAVSLR
jgi:hypothetical protein